MWRKKSEIFDIIKMPAKKLCNGTKKDGSKCYNKEQVDGYCGVCLGVIRRKLAKSIETTSDLISITEVQKKCIRCPDIITVVNGILTCQKCLEISSKLQIEKREQSDRCQATYEKSENPCTYKAVNGTMYCRKHKYLTVPIIEGKVMCSKASCRVYLEEQDVKDGFKKCAFHREQAKCNETRRRENHYKYVDEQLKNGINICRNYKCGRIFDPFMTYSGIMSTKCLACNGTQKAADAKRPHRVRVDNRDPERRAAWKKYYHENHYDKVVAWYRRYRQKQEDLLGREKCLEMRAAAMKEYRLLHPEIMKQIYEKSYNTPENRLKCYKAMAAAKGIEWKLTDERAIEHFKSPCYYCGKEATESKLNGIDKICYDGIYEDDNVLPCCKNCNMAKKCLDIDVFLCRAIHISDFCLSEDSVQLFPLSSYDSVSKKTYATLLCSAKKRNIPVNLTEEQFLHLKKEPCYLCGKKNSDTHNNGLDRIDSKLEYSIHNCKSCCASCNYMKKELELDKFLEKCHQISAIHKCRIMENPQHHERVGCHNFGS